MTLRDHGKSCGCVLCTEAAIRADEREKAFAELRPLLEHVLCDPGCRECDAVRKVVGL